MSFFNVLTLIFVVFKLLGFITWSWWLVFLPLYGSWILIGLPLILFIAWCEKESSK